MTDVIERLIDRAKAHIHLQGVVPADLEARLLAEGVELDAIYQEEEPPTDGEEVYE